MGISMYRKGITAKGKDREVVEWCTKSNQETARGSGNKSRSTAREKGGDLVGFGGCAAQQPALVGGRWRSRGQSPGSGVT